MQSFFAFATLTRDPTLRNVGAKNTAVCNFGIAVNTGYGEKKETLFLECTAWAKMAESIQATLKKGSKATIYGRLKNEEWADKNTGELKKKITLTVDQCMFGTAGNKPAQTQAATSTEGGDSEEDLSAMP